VREVWSLRTLWYNVYALRASKYGGADRNSILQVVTQASTTNASRKTNTDSQQITSCPFESMTPVSSFPSTFSLLPCPISSINTFSTNYTGLNMTYTSAGVCAW